jgi:4'-phosphopantetheinyl transferase
MEFLALPVDETDDKWVAAWSHALDVDELRQADRFRRTAERIRYIAAHALLRTALGAATGRPSASLTLTRGPYGKPFLPALPALHFSLTHTVGLTAVALHSSPVGCDAEPSGRHVKESVFSMMAAEERSWLRGLSPGEVTDRAFIKLWVIKEAFSKALGLGLSLDLASYAFDLTGPEIHISHAPSAYTRDIVWNFAATMFGLKHWVALAVQGDLGSAVLPCPRHLSADIVAEAAAGGPPLQLSANSLC